MSTDPGTTAAVPDAAACRRRGCPRRVLMTADAVGGVWQYSLDLARALDNRGVFTTVAVLGPPPSGAQRREAARAGVAIIESPYRLEWMDGGIDDLAPSGEWLLLLERALCADVVHLNGFAHAALPWQAPQVLVAHSCVRTWWRAVKHEPAPRAYERYTAAVVSGLRAAPAVVAPSAAMLHALTAEYGISLRSRVIPNGCAPRRPASAPATTRSKEPFVLTAGRAWDEAKNIAALCAIAEQLPWPIYVAGDTCSPQGMACALPGVHALGRISTRAMLAWYERAAVYALPARYEPFGLSVLEAARAGCALVLGDIPSLREHWDGAALFVAPDDHQRLAAVIQQLVNEPDERVALGQRAEARACMFTIDRTADAYLELYEGLIA